MSSASPDHRQKTTSAPSPIGLRAPALRPRSVARSPALSPATMMRAGCARSASLWCCGRVGRRPSSMPTRYVCRPPVGSWWPGFSYAGGWEGVELCTDSAGADVPVRALLLAGGNSRSRRPGPRTAPHAARRHRPRGVHTARRARRSTGRAGLTWGAPLSTPYTWTRPAIIVRLSPCTYRNCSLCDRPYDHVPAVVFSEAARSAPCCSVERTEVVGRAWFAQHLRRRPA